MKHAIGEVRTVPAAGAARFAPAAVLAVAFLLAIAGCAKRAPQPVIPHSAHTQHTRERIAFAGRDTTRITVSLPDFVGAGSGDALDSLQLAVVRLSRASAIVPGRDRASLDAVMDEFIAAWNDNCEKTKHCAPWRFRRTIEVAADTLGVIELRATDQMAGEIAPRRVQILRIDAMTGRMRAEGTAPGR